MQLRDVIKEKRGLAQKNAALVDQVSTLEEAYGELKAHLKRLLGGRGQMLALAPGQELLFGEPGDSGDALTSAIRDLGQDDDEDIAELTGDDALVPDAEEAKPAKRSKQRNRRKLAEADLQREIRRSELPPDERRCPVTGLEMVETGVKVATELSYRKAELFVVEHHQVIYGPAPEIAQERTVEPIMSPAPEAAVEGVKATAALLAWLLCQKYVLHLPLYRQEDAFARLGVALSRQTLCDWVMKSAFALRPVAGEIERQIRAGPVLQIDDPPIKVRRAGPGGGKEKVKQSYLWVLKNPEVSGVVFRFTEGRATADVASLLQPESALRGVEVILGDGYQANRSGAREAGLEVNHAGCWAHLLRKFRDALTEAPHAMSLYMKDIAELYAIERRGRDDQLDSDAMLELRRRESMPIATNLMRVTSGWKNDYSLEGKVAAAMKYVRGQRHALLEFRRDGRVPIDNNACERAIRPVVVGRRNWLFAGSVDGARAAATIYTLVESAKASRVDPLAYLEVVVELHGRCPAPAIAELTPLAMSSELLAYRDRGADA